jgi:hypothetical protein
MYPDHRHEAIQTLAAKATTDHLAAAALLYAAREEKDYVRLGLESWAAYLDSVGVSRSQDSKLRKAYSTFGGEWGRAMGLGLTTERLYLAARVTERDGLDYQDGLALAVNTPSHELVARLKGEELEPTMCACPECGHSHRRKEAA